MACPPLTYGVMALAALTFFLSLIVGVASDMPPNGIPSVLVIAILQPVAILLTLRDPDIAFVWGAWMLFAKGRIANTSVVLVR